MPSELVGREPELAVLTGCLTAALEGRPQLVLCQGEPGIGKTRLAAELVGSASAQGVLTAWGLAADSSSAPPYWPWWQVLRTVADTVDVASISQARRLDADLARLAPDVFVSLPAEAGGGGSVDDRFRQFDAAARLMREVCRQRALMIVLDDVHWADQPTLLLLQHLARTVTDERLLVLVNSRTTEGPHRELLSRLARHPQATVIHLRGLGAPAIRQQLASVVGGEVGDPEVAEVEALTGGNPLFVGEVGRAMADARAGRRFSPVTPTIREAIGDRLDQLSPECVRFLEAAAVVGRAFAVPVVSTMADLPAVHGLGLVDEAQRAGLVEVGSSPHEHRFMHALVGDAIAARIAPVERVHLHRRAAEAIEEHHRHDLGRHLFDIARHWAEAGVEAPPGEAAGWLERAAHEAMRQFAYEEAARLYRQALELGGGHLDDERRCRLWLAAARAHDRSADLGARVDACLEAAEIARRMHRPDLVAEAALVGEMGHGGFDISTRRLCQEALATLDPGATALRARMTARFVETFIFHDLGSVAQASEDALDLAARSGDRDALIAALRARQLVRSGPDGLEERVRLAERLLALSHEADDLQTELWARLCRIDAAFEAGDFARVGAEIEAVVLCAQQVRGPLARFEVSRCRAVLAQAQGRLADALRLESEAFDVLAPTGHPLPYVLRSGLLGAIGHHVGQDDRSVVANTFVDAPEGMPDRIGLIAHIASAHVLVSAGRTDEAAGIYRSLGPASRWQPPPHVLLFTSAFGIAVATALDASDDVAALRDRLAPYRGHHVASGTSAIAYFGPVELWLGKANHHLGRLDEAVTDLEQAEQACATSGAAAFRVEVQYELARVLARRDGPGDRARARSLARAAAGAASDLGLTPFVDRAGELRGQLDDAGDVAPLTRREREVSGLVAQGLTNREIAARLFVSERTAENHVQHILTKLGLSNRSQIAVWASNRE